MEDTDQLILDSAQRLFSDHCSPERVNGAERGQAAEQLRAAVGDAGLPLAWVPESAGGVGGSLALGFRLIRQAAGFALPLPLAEALVANRLLAEGGLAPADTWPALVYDGGELPVVLERGAVEGVVQLAPGLAGASLLLVPVSHQGRIKLATFRPERLAIEARESLAGESRARVSFEAAVPEQLTGDCEAVSEGGLKQFCALVRACQIAGALQTINELTVRYVKERKQFGRPLGNFQAIQHKVADISGEVALANAAVEQAMRVLTEHPRPFAGGLETVLPIATAKVVSSEAAGRVTRHAHQAHGAMGFSYDYPLQQYSRRVWSWREEYGSEFYWSECIARAVAGEVADGAAGPGGTSVWDVISRY